MTSDTLSRTIEPQTLENVNIEAVETYRRLVLAKFEGEDVDGNELRRTCLFLGVALSQFESDVESLRRRQRRVEQVLRQLDTQPQWCTGSPDRESVFCELNSHQQYVEAESAWCNERERSLKGRLAEADRHGPQIREPHHVPFRMPIYQVLNELQGESATGEQDDCGGRAAMHAFKAAVESALSLGQRRENLMSDAVSVNGIADEITRLEARLEWLRACVAQGMQARTESSRLNAEIERAKEAAREAGEKLVIRGAKLSGDASR
jgi:hypothetical protein